MSSMTIEQLRAECVAFARDVGPKAYVTVHVASDLEGYAAIYPKGLTHGDRDGWLTVRGIDWSTMLADLRAKWEAHAAEHHAKIVRRMAAQIIRLTADFGSCTDAQLRGDFEPDEVARFGTEAVEEANRIAATGPFAITPAAGANLIAAE